MIFCKKECEKMLGLFDCYCDSGCNLNKDCCVIENKRCAKMFNNNDSGDNLPVFTNVSKPVVIGSCCKDYQPLDCFCDVKCSLLNDCCKDYNKCFNNKNLLHFSNVRSNRKDTITKVDAKAIDNDISYNGNNSQNDKIINVKLLSEKRLKSDKRLYNIEQYNNTETFTFKHSK